MPNDIEIHIKGDAKDAEKAVESFTEKLKVASGDLKKVGAAMLGFGAALTAGLTLSVKAAAEEEAGIAKLSQALKNVGVNYDAVQKSLEANIEATQQKTAIADDQQRDALQKLIEVTGDYQSALGLMPLTLDLAAAKGMDFGMAAEVIGRVAAGNVTILSRYGIQLKEGATATEALTALTQKFGGQAEKMGSTVAGQMKLLKANFGDAMESLGNALLPAVTKLTQSLNGLVLWFKNLSPEMQKVIAISTAVTAAIATLGGAFLLFLGFLPSILAGFKALSIVLHAIGGAFHAALGPIGLITLAVAAVSAGVIWMIKNWDIVKPALQKAVNAMLGGIEWFANGAIRGFNAVIRGINSFSSAISFGAIPAIKEISEIHLPRLEVSAKKTAQGGKEAAEGIKTSFENAAEAMKANLQKVVDQADKFGGQLVAALKARNEEIEKGEITSIQKVIDAVEDGTDEKIRIYGQDRDARISSIGAMKGAAIDAFEREVAEARWATGEKIAEYQREAKEKLAGILGPGNEHMKQLQAEIDKINETQDLNRQTEKWRTDAARQNELIGRIEAIQAKIIQENIKENTALGRWDIAEAKKAKEERIKLNKELTIAEGSLAEFRRQQLLRFTDEQQNARKKNLAQSIQNILASQKSVKEAATEEVRIKAEQAQNELKQKEKDLEKSLALTTGNLDKELTAINKNYEKQKTARLKALGEDLTAVKEHFATLNTEEALQAEARTLVIEANNDEIIALLNSYNPKWQDAGQSFGQKLIEGLNSEKAGVQAAVNDMLALVSQASVPQASISQVTAPQVITPEQSLKRAVEIATGAAITPFQEGGLITRPTLALLGERGPELVTPLGRSMASSTANIAITIVNRGIIGVEDLDKHIFQAIRDGKRRGAFQGVIA